VDIYTRIFEFIFPKEMGFFQFILIAVVGSKQIHINFRHLFIFFLYHY